MIHNDYKPFCENTSERLFKLIEAFDQMAGVPAVLNTSFDENELMVCRLGQGMEYIFNVNMSSLFLSNSFLKRACE